MSRSGAVVLVVLLLSTSRQVIAAPQPRPPQNGKHSVQMIVGGSNRIPMCIVPPRLYEDGTAIVPGTPCTIVIYRSRENGRRNTYNEEVGRGQGQVTRPNDLQPWVDVTAVVPPDKPDGGTFYLASSAIVGGVESDLNNQWLTIEWSPGHFQALGYPPFGPDAGQPPGRRASPVATVAPLDYPAWTRGEATGPSSATAYETSLPEWVGAGGPTKLRFELTGESVTGAVVTQPIVDHFRKKAPDSQVTFPLNRLSGRLTAGALASALEFTVVAANKDGEMRVETVADLRGTVLADRRIQGRAKALRSMKIGPERAGGDVVEWPFTATPLGAAARRRAIGTQSGSSAARVVPGNSFRYPAAMTSPEHRTQFERWLHGVIRLRIGDRYLVQQRGTPDTYADGSRRALPSAATRKPGEKQNWFAGPASVVASEPLGDGLRLRAVGDGVAEVWTESRWLVGDETGAEIEGGYMSTWLVLVGTAAQSAYDASLGAREPLPPRAPGPLTRGTIRGRALTRDGRPVAGARVTLVRTDTRTAYQSDSWVTREDGVFNLYLSRESSGLGLAEGRYEVVVIRRSTNAGGPVGPGGDLWPVSRTTIELTRDALNAGTVAVEKDIVMDRVSTVYHD